MMDQNSPKNSIQKENPKETSKDCLQQRIRPWLPTKSKLQSRRERFGKAHPKSRDIPSVLDCERGKKKKTLCDSVVGLRLHRCITLR
jgi:hypothetical protein